MQEQTGVLTGRGAHAAPRRGVRARSAVRALLCAATIVASQVSSVTAQSAPEIVWARGGHSLGVVRTVYSPDGTRFATCGGDDAKIWRASDGQLLHTLVTDLLPFPWNNSVKGLDFSSDGQLLATAGWDSTVRLWSVADGTLLRTITDSGNYLNTVAVSPDGQFVCAGGGPSGTIRMWSVATGALVRSLTGHTDWVNDVAFSPDGQRIASASSDDRIRVWNAATGGQVWSVVAHDSAAVGVDYSPDGLVLGSAGGVTQPRVKTWNANTGAPIRTYVGQTHDALDVKFSPDGQRVAGSGGDGQVRIWETATGTLQLFLPVSVPPTGVGFDFSPDGARIIAGDSIRRVTMWNAVTGQLEREVSAHPGWVHGLDFSPDGASLASAAFVIPLLCPVKVYNVASGEPTANLGDVPWGLTDLRYSSNGRYLAGSSGGGPTYLIDLTDQSPDYTIPVAGNSDFPWFARFSPDDTLLASGGTEGTIQLWSVTDPPQLVDFINFGASEARNAEFTPDGTKLIIAVGCGIVIWDLTTDEESIITFPPCQQNVSDIKVAPDGLTFFASNSSGASGSFPIRQFDVTTHAQIRTFVGHTAPIHSIDLSSDGRFLISGGADFTVRLWSVADGTLLQTHDQECGYNTTTGAEGVPRVVFSPDDSLFAYGRNDGTIVVARNPFAALPGDVNCDGNIDFFDIDPFLLALFDLPTYVATYCGGSIAGADVDGSGVVDFFDIDLFLTCLFAECP